MFLTTIPFVQALTDAVSISLSIWQVVSQVCAIDRNCFAIGQDADMIPVHLQRLM
jgi:hypothetical protein